MRQIPAFVIVLVVIAMAGGISLLIATQINAHGGNRDLIHGCIDKETRDVRIIKARQRCAEGEISGHWSIEGEAGPQGLEGPAGPTGDTGEPGFQGEQGAQGDQGLSGDPETPGVQGLAGLPGLQGDPGIQGLDGLQGVPGESVAPGIHGEQGSVGPAGETGLQGEPGLSGEIGQQGAQGLPGDRGLQGQQGIPGEQGLVGLPGIQGEQGPARQTGDQGIQGLVGLQGEQGLIGLQGDQGDSGSDGLQGAPGEQGVPGSTGEQGPAGPAGPPGEAAPVPPNIPSDADAITAMTRAGGILRGSLFPPTASTVYRLSVRSIAVYAAMSCSEGTVSTPEGFEAFVVDEMAPWFKGGEGAPLIPDLAFELFVDLRSRALAGDRAGCMRPYAEPVSLDEAWLGLDLALANRLPMAGLSFFQEWLEDKWAPDLVYQWFEYDTTADPSIPLLEWFCLEELIPDCPPVD